MPEFQAYDVKQTSDGGYLVAGGIHNINGGDFILVKTDSIGNELFTYSNDRYNGMDGSNAIYSLEISQNNIYLVGGITPIFGSRQRVYIVKLDSQFNKIWEVEDSGLGGISAAVKIKLSKDQNLIITGSTASDTTVKIYTAKIDTAGQFIWKNYFPLQSNTGGIDILDIDLNKFIVCGTYIVSNGAPYDSSASIILCFDTTGQYIWYHEYPDTIFNGFSSIVLGSDNKIYCGQYYAPKYSNPNNPSSSIVCYDSTGNFIYRKEFLNADANYVGVVEKQNGGFIVAHDFSDFLFLNIYCDSIGSLHLSNSYPINSLILDSENRGVVVGNYQQQAGHPYFSYIMRISDTTITHVQEYFDSHSVIVYPNPSNGLFKALSSNLNKEFEYVEVYSIYGKVLYHKEVSKESEINLTQFLNGIYFLKIKLKNNPSIIVKPIEILKK